MNRTPGPESDPKAALRRTALAQRRDCHKTRAEAAAADLRNRTIAEISGEQGAVAGYWPIGDEIDCRPTLAAFAQKGVAVALPVVAGQNMVLLFRAWAVGDQLDPGPFGTVHPNPRAQRIEPNILLVPLVAFDGTGHRLGYGAGFYDRTITALRSQRSMLVVGLAYDEQEIAQVPAGSHDARMDGIITDRRTLWFK